MICNLWIIRNSDPKLNTDTTKYRRRNKLSSLVFGRFIFPPFEYFFHPRQSNHKKSSRLERKSGHFSLHDTCYRSLVITKNQHKLYTYFVVTNCGWFHQRGLLSPKLELKVFHILQTMSLKPNFSVSLEFSRQMCSIRINKNKLKFFISYE